MHYPDLGDGYGSGHGYHEMCGRIRAARATNKFNVATCTYLTTGGCDLAAGILVSRWYTSTSLQRAWSNQYRSWTMFSSNEYCSLNGLSSNEHGSLTVFCVGPVDDILVEQAWLVDAVLDPRRTSMACRCRPRRTSMAH
jgi:hypothetical protein